jgi:hypothetical protein
MSDGILSYDGKPLPETAQEMWSEKSFGDFELVCDWRMSGPGECAINVRGSKKDIALKSDKKAGTWNRSILRMQGDRLTLRTNGVVVADNVQQNNLPASGPLAVVSNGPIQLRNLFVRELKANQ